MEFSSRVIVAEFKNNSDPIGQREVESLQQYLFPGAMRAFGILCCRKPPSEQALKARRRAWMLNKVMIVFLHDEDLIDMVRKRSEKIDPMDGVDLQLDEFFMSLAP